MSASQRGGPQVLDRPENSGNSAEALARETQVQFEDVDSPFQIILFADDQSEILQARRLLLEALGFSVLIADSGEKVLHLILFADDQSEILQARRLLLEALGLSVLIADSGEKVLHLLRDGAIDAAVVDDLLSGIEGEQTAPGIREVDGNMPIILSSRCFSLPQSVSGLVDAPADKRAMSKALQEALEQQLRALMHGDETLTS